MGVYVRIGRSESGQTRGTGLDDDFDYQAAHGLDKTVVRVLAKDSAWVRNHENTFVIGPCGMSKRPLDKMPRTGYRSSMSAPLAIVLRTATRQRGAWRKYANLRVAPAKFR